MSEGSASKKLKQLRLPFALLSPPGTSSSPKPAENTSPKTPVMSRKRKPSSDSEFTRFSKIGRKGSKENIAAEQDEILEIKDSEEENEIEEQSEISPTTSGIDEEGANVLHIKLPTSRRKINMDSKPSEDDPDDSVVYLDEKEVKKSCKKSRKKKKKISGAGADGKISELNEEFDGVPACKEEAFKLKSDEKTVDQEKSTKTSASSETDDNQTPKGKKSKRQAGLKPEPNAKKVESRNSEPETKELESDEKKEESKKKSLRIKKAKIAIEESPAIAEKKIKANLSQDIPMETDEKIAEKAVKSFSTIPSKSSSPHPEDPEVIHAEIAEVLSDHSDTSAKGSAFPSDDLNRTPTQSKLEITKLTPKQLAWRQELETRRLEKELQRQKERDAKEQQRLKEKEAREEAKKKEKEDKEDARKKEKEDRDKKKQAELEKKEEERRQKEEEKRAKEEEKKRQAEQRDEEKRKREEVQSKKTQEEENRKKRAAEAFSKFFVAKKKETPVSNIDEESKESAESGESTISGKLAFMPFQVREQMRLAPCTRCQLSKEQKAKLDELKGSGKGVDQLYLKQLKNPSYRRKSMGSTWPAEADDDNDILLIADELEGLGEDIQSNETKTKMKHRAKYLMFVDNRRPAFHGTWRKKSKNITARKPFAQDQKFFDYEVDSDDEWEEEEPGESLNGSDSEKEKDAPEEEYEVDNDFFVPHGHLSDEEMNAEDDGDNRPEAQKAKLKILQQEFAAEMKKKTEKIKPRLIGCVWLNGDEDENGCSGNDDKYHCSDIIWRILKAREAWTSDDGIKFEENFEPEIAEPEDEPKTPAQQKVQIRAKFNDSSLKELIQLLHGNVNNRKFLGREFQAYRLKNFHKDPGFLEFSLKTVDEKILEISDYKSCPDEGPMFGKKCWYVKPEIMQEVFGDEKPKLPNEWNYILEKEKKAKPAGAGDGPKKEGSPIEEDTKEVVKPKTPIAVAKPKTPLASKPAQQSPAGGVTKKRVQLLMSVPRGESISESKKNNLIKQYLKAGTVSASGSSPVSKKAPEKMDVDGVVVLD